MGHCPKKVKKKPWVVCPSVCPSVIIFFVSAQYLQNSFIEFIQILYVHWYWHDLAWDCYTSFFPSLYQSYSPLFTPKFCFRSISWELLDIFLPNFIYALILTRSSLGLLHVIFWKLVPDLWPFIMALYLLQNFVSTWPFIYSKISCPLNILRTTRHIFTKFYICIDIDKI